MKEFAKYIPDIIGAGITGIIIYLIKKYGTTVFEMLKTKLEKLKDEMGNDLFNKAVNIARLSVSLVIDYLNEHPDIKDKVTVAYTMICDCILKVLPLSDEELLYIWDLIKTEFVGVFGEDFDKEIINISSAELLTISANVRYKIKASETNTTKKLFER